MAIVEYSSKELGNFSYNDEQFKIDKIIYPILAGHTKSIEILRYIGKTNKPEQPKGIQIYYAMFSGRSDLETIDLSDWDMSEAICLTDMFSGCLKLKDISSLKDWNVSKVFRLRNMFSRCESLMDISPLENWNVSSVKDIKRMFSYCLSLVDSTPLEKWNLKLEFYSCCGVFLGCGESVNRKLFRLEEELKNNDI